MNIFMREDHSVPFLFAYRTVHKEPKIERKRRFVGLKAGLLALRDKAIDLVLESFWTTEQEVLDAGKSEVVNYAVEISDTPGASGPELVVTRLDGSAKPGCGIYCEIVKFEKPVAPAGAIPPTQPESKAKLVSPRMPRPNGNQAPASILQRIANLDKDTKP